TGTSAPGTRERPQVGPGLVRRYSGAMKALARAAGAAAASLILGTAAGAASGREYVLWTGSKVYVTADGQGWRQVTPRGAVRPGTFRAIEAVAFRGAREGWLIASDCSTGRGSVYRSSDGGGGRHAYSFHAHSCARAGDCCALCEK